MARNWYAWSDLYNGGKTKIVKTSNGSERTVVAERYIIERGEKVTKSKLDVSDEDWDRLVEGGSIRSYPVPDNASASVSPARAVMQRLVNDTGDIDPNILMELAMKHPPPLNLPADEVEDKEADLPAGA